MHRLEIVPIMGRPGSGKGTQARALAARLGGDFVDLGQLIRVATGTTGHAQALAQGSSVPSSVSEPILRQQLEMRVAQGRRLVFLDGYPREYWQVERLDLLVPDSRVPAAVELELPPRQALGRILGRLVCGACGQSGPPHARQRSRCECGGRYMRRKDDEHQAIQRRLELFERNMPAVLAEYSRRGLLTTVVATLAVGEATDQVLSSIRPRLTSMGAELPEEQLDLFSRPAQSDP
jgi:adenylate kinase